VSIWRKIGALAAIAALPGLLGGPLTAQQWHSSRHDPSAQVATFVPPTRAGRPASRQPDPAPQTRHGSDPKPDFPSSADHGQSPKPGKPRHSEFLARPASDRLLSEAAPLASFAVAKVDHQLIAQGKNPAPLEFRLEDARTRVGLTATTPLIRGPYDRLSSDYVTLPVLEDQTRGKRRDDLLSEPQTPSVTRPEPAQAPAFSQFVPALEQALEQDRDFEPQAVLATAEAIPVRTNMVRKGAPLGVRAPEGAKGKTAEAVRPANLPIVAPPQQLAPQQQQNFDIRPGAQVFPVEENEAAFTIDDELILQLKIKGFDSTDTIVAYGTRDAVYLPVGEIARILDLAIRVSDQGNYANGWFLEETRTISINLREKILNAVGSERLLKPGDAQAFDGEMFLRSELFSEILPLELQPNLRAQAIYLVTLEPFPFEERRRRETERAQLGARHARPGDVRWPRQETPWLAASTPLADFELRAVSDSPMGERLEGDLRLGADLAFMTAQSYFSATTRDGLVASLLQLGRRNAEGNLLGPLDATEFQFGDVATSSMPVGLRGQAGRGAYITNRPFQNASVFEQIDLRGILPNGYEVELYRNDILVGSIANAANDQYEFLEVPVDYGLNVFRLVFYGPQGQRREEVRRVAVGDGRLAKGQFEYDAGVVQRGENLLGVRGPNFNPLEGFGSWQAAARLSYGLSSKVTAVTSFAHFEEDSGGLTVATAGLRTGFGNLAFRADGALGTDGATALGAGIGGRLLGGAFSLSHFEYGGGFRDEIRSNSRDPLRRATELDFNGTIKLPGQAIPIAARIRHTDFANGRSDTDAIFRSSFRLPGVVLSNSMEYSRNTIPDGSSFSQLIGNFDLATFSRSRMQMRASLGYSLLQGPEITNGSAEIAYEVDDRTTVSGQAFYAFGTGEFGFGASAVREFNKFTLAIDGNYAFEQKSYSIALRIGFSLGRDPLKRNLFAAPPGLASSGAVSLRAFQDMDGNGAFGEGDVPLKDVSFSVFNNTTTSDEQGMARLTRLGNGNPVAVQVDPSSLPDILMAPASRGVEIVPRSGRFHVMDFPFIALSEIEGTITFEGADTSRGVSGLRLLLLDHKGEIAGSTRTERGGYYFFEQIKPGAFKLALDQEQAERLGICMVTSAAIEIAPTGDIYKRDAVIRECTSGAREAGTRRAPPVRQGRSTLAH
jgi:hypothetical protein